MSTENQFEELPDGITLNAVNNNDFILEKQQEVINTSKCTKCNVVFESVLTTTNGRHEGHIKIVGSNVTVWKNSLPKDRVRCMRMLDEVLKNKLDIHKESSHND